MNIEQIKKLAINGDDSIVFDNFSTTIIDNLSRTPLHYLAIRKKSKILLHNASSKLHDIYGLTPLHLLARFSNNDNEDIISYPNVHKIINLCKVTPLHLLAAKGVIEVLSNTFSDKIEDSHKNTPLHIISNTVSDPNDVLGYDLNLFVKNMFGNTPLHILAKKKVYYIINNPDVGRVKNEKGNTPLHILCSIFGKSNFVYHDDITRVKNEKGNTPLHILANKGVLECEKHSKFEKIKNCKGLTPKNILGVNYSLNEMGL